MKKLLLEFPEGGYMLKQERRSEKCAIYTQTWGKNGSVVWEVVIPQIHTQAFTDGKWQPCEPYEGYPSPKQWGDQAWTFLDLESAIRTYRNIDQDGPQTLDVLRRNRRSSKPVG
jgi:hypothetical protein